MSKSIAEMVGKYYRENKHDEFWNIVVDKLGYASVLNCIPFDDKTLVESFHKDKYFNTNKTPIQLWDNAAGFNVESGDVSRKPGKSLLQYLLADHNVEYYSLSDCVCILKTAARRRVEEIENKNGKAR